MKLRRGGTGRTAAAVTALAALLTAGLGAAPALGQPAAAGHSARSAQSAGAAKGTPSLTTSAAQAAAAKSGDRVEILSLRDERSTTYANPDGTFTTDEYVQPVRTRVDGKWTDIDTTLVRQKNGSYAPKAALSAMSFSGGGDTTFAEIQQDGRSLSLDWPEKLPKPTIDGSTATYTDVLPGVDLKVTASAEGFSHVLVVKNAKAAANPELDTLQLPVDTSSVKLKETAGGGLTATDTGSGGTVFEAPQPVMWDSSHTAADEPTTDQENTQTPPRGRPGRRRRRGRHVGHDDPHPRQQPAHRQGHRLPGLHRPRGQDRQPKLLDHGVLALRRHVVLEVRRRRRRRPVPLRRVGALLQFLRREAAVLRDPHRDLRGQGHRRRGVRGDPGLHLQLQCP
ncbi:hypothetical protein [Streptomyces mangrovisoli]|uniref:hypothetical protein n=1 Tax=Streptomyces mangrovisoli TaxID=1428628 RepID=UPI000A66EBA2|nr:hypothetical protein [Streptomyces mangrovisoli]